MYFVAVHGGAGNHPTSDSKLKKALRLACSETLSKQLPALSAVELSISVLEDDECLNAGFGSNLTIDGKVECDASIMDDYGVFGSVGAVSGIKHPITLAQTVLEHSQIPDILGRIPPLTLVSSGAYYFAEQKNTPTCSPDALVSPRALDDWRKWKTRLEITESIRSPAEPIDAMQDTVGAVVWDNENRLAAGVSSGGLLLKLPGRVGEAAVFGAGCWAESRGDLGIACSISGAGEQIVRASLARSIAEAVFTAHSQNSDFDTHSVLERILTEQFIKLCGSEKPQAGIILLTKEPNSDSSEGFTTRLWCAFTTPSMAIAYASSFDPKPKALILRKPDRTSVDDNHSVFIISLPLSRI